MKQITPADLTNAKGIVGFRDITVGGGQSGAPLRAGGSCDLCSTGIRYALEVQLADDRIIKVGSTCAGRVGVTVAEYWEERRKYSNRLSAEANRARFEAMPKVTPETADPAELEVIYFAADRPRGSVDRIVDWTANKLRGRGWVKPEQFEQAVLAASGFEIPPMQFAQVEALFDLDGQLLATDKGWGEYGPYFKTDEGQFYNPSQAKNPKTEANNNRKKGFYLGLVIAEAGEDGWELRTNGRFGPLENVVRVIDSGAGVEGVEILCQGHCQDAKTTKVTRFACEWLCPRCLSDVTGK